MKEYQCYIVRKACDLGYILVQLFLENEICHIILTGHYKKSKFTVLIHAHLGRAYDNIEITEVSNE